MPEWGRKTTALKLKLGGGGRGCGADDGAGCVLNYHLCLYNINKAIGWKR